MVEFAHEQLTRKERMEALRKKIDVASMLYLPRTVIDSVLSLSASEQTNLGTIYVAKCREAEKRQIVFERSFEKEELRVVREQVRRLEGRY